MAALIYDPYRGDAPPPGISLADYARAWVDMAPHAEQLTALARDAQTIVEFGIRGGVSTWALLDGLPSDGVLYGVDVDPSAPVPARVLNDRRFVRRTGDTLLAELPSHADLAVIDSSHEFLATLAELARVSAVGPDRIALHDYLYPDTPQVHEAVDLFLAKQVASHPNNPFSRVRRYRLAVVHPSHWGLAVLEAIE